MGFLSNGFAAVSSGDAMTAMRIFEQPKARTVRCQVCNDSGLVFLDGGPRNGSLDEICEKLAPCACEAGDSQWASLEACQLERRRCGAAS